MSQNVKRRKRRFQKIDGTHTMALACPNKFKMPKRRVTATSTIGMVRDALDWFEKYLMKFDKDDWGKESTLVIEVRKGLNPIVFRKEENDDSNLAVIIAPMKPKEERA